MTVSGFNAFKVTDLDQCSQGILLPGQGLKRKPTNKTVKKLSISVSMWVSFKATQDTYSESNLINLKPVYNG